MDASQEKARRELAREALRQIDDLHVRLARSQAVLTAPIAIVGIGCRYPGGITDPDSFWRLLAARVDAISEVPADRWRLADWYDADPAAPGRASTRWGGFMADVDRFDADFFGITPREAALLDPQHRIALEVAYEAIEHAGLDADRLQGSATGVFVGMTTTEYQQQLLGKLPPEALSPYLVTGNVPNAAAGRIAYTLGLHGPSMAIDTACSSSLTAVHVACQSLRAGDCDTALAGGVNVILAPETVVMFSKWGMMAADGRCKTFDAAADGFVRSEGCAVIVLKRLDDAIAAGENVLAVIEGSAINQDGRSSGLTVPNGRAQEALMRKALASAGVAPADIDYVEAHGTGTALGDPIELDALGAVFAPGRGADAKLRIGSIKTNLGHTEAASGIAGLIKCVLAMEHEEIPPQIHFREPTPDAEWDRLPFEVVAEPIPWPRGPRRRRAGVSSFGFSGGNAHVVIADPPTLAVPAGEARPTIEILTLSARDPDALVALARRYAAHLRTTDAPLADICATANTGRSRMRHRLYVCGDTHARLAEQIEGIVARPLAECSSYASVAGAPRIGFLFSGQGSQYLGMGRARYGSQPVFRRAFDRCAAILTEHLDRSLLDIVFSETEADGLLLGRTGYTQPALFSLEWALAELWSSLGIQPAALLGHSLGEYVAACRAGVLTLEDALRLVTARAEIMQALPPGGMMVAIVADRDAVDRFLAPYTARVAIAAENGPRSFVLSGERDAVTEIVAAMDAEGMSAVVLNVSHAFHSPAMDPILPEFERLAAETRFASAQVAVVSNLTGRVANGEELKTGGYWRRHLRERVRFAEGFLAMQGEGCDTFVEIGPDPVLTTMARRMDAAGALWLPSLMRGSDDRECFLASLGRLFIAGAPVDWSGLYVDRTVRRCALPTYPFQRRRHWIDALPARTSATAHNGRLTRVPASPLIAERIFSRDVSLASDPDLADHVVAGEVLIPMTAFLMLAFEAARAVLGAQHVALTDVIMAQRAVLRDEQTLALQVVLAPEAPNGGWSLRIISLTDEEPGSYVLHVSARALLAEALVDAAGPDHASDGMTTIGADEHVQAMQERGFAFGPAFRGVAGVCGAPGFAIGEVECAGEPATFSPGLLDVCMQPLIHAWVEPGAAKGFLPFAIDRIEIIGTPVPRMRSICRARMTSSDGATMTGDVTVQDAVGKPLVLVRGLTARARDDASSSPAIDALVYERTWQPVAGRALDDRSAADFLLPDAAGHTIAALPAHARAAADGYALATAVLNRRASDFVGDALATLGWVPEVGEVTDAPALARRLDIVPRYERLIDRFLSVLAEEGFCARGEAGWTVQREIVATGRSTVDPVSTASFAAELRLLDRCGAALPAVLRGDIDPLELLFGQAAEGELEQIYAHSPVTLASNEVAADLVAELAARRPAGTRVSILEIGGGTGGTTSHILPRLGTQAVDYCFTDIGPALVSGARRRFKDAQGMRFDVLDIERDLEGQDLGGQRFDIVVAANVLHATRDLTAALVRARQLLKPGGVIVLIEGTRPQAWIDVTFGLTDGWWKFADYDLRADYPLLAASAWLSLLEATGFANPLRLDGPAAPDEESSYAVFAANAASPAAKGSWLVFDTGDAIAKELVERGETVLKVRPGAEPGFDGADTWIIRPDARADYDRLLRIFGEQSCCGVVHAWLSDREISGDSGNTEAASRLGIESLLNLSQELLRRDVTPDAGLWLVSRGAQAAGPDVSRLAPGGALAWGFAKTLGLEHPELKVRRLDLDPAGEDLAAAVDLFLHPPLQAEMAFRAGSLHEPRIERRSIVPAGPVRLVAPEIGSLDALVWQAAERPTPGAREVTIQVAAASLNFRDVLRVLGMYSGATGNLGGEVAGTVVAIGDEVRGVAVGDVVGAIAFGGFSSFVTTDAALVMQRPAGWSLADLASIPGAFATAYHALVQLARARAGERVLIHTATGGVGLAAIQIARAIGCEIFASAGSEEKRAYLRELGIEHVFDSRTTAFTDGIRTLVADGVDVIVNTLGADFTDANVATLADNGRFVELGRRELWDADRIMEFRPAARYFAVDLARAAAESPDEIAAMLATARDAISAGDLAPLPTTIFAPERAKDAFRLMAQARHIGKVIVALQPAPALVPSVAASSGATARFTARADRSYLITGGLGGLGLETARWLVERGARHLALLGRSPATPAAQSVIEAMRADGVAVLTVRGDVADHDDVKRLFSTIREQLPPLAGIIHSAGVLDDGAIVNQTWPRIAHVLGPKRDGTWNLHVASGGMPLDLFVSYSSASAILGSPGQASHAAANAYQDALMHHRRALGLPGLSINWGAWSAIGAAANAAVAGHVSSFGVGMISPAEGLASLEALILAQAAQAMVVRANWSRFLAMERPSAEQVAFESLGTPASTGLAAASRPTEVKVDFASFSGAERRAAVLELVRSSLGAIIGLAPDAALDPNRALRDIGLDSLMSVELRNRLQTALGRSLPTTLIFDFPTIAALVDHVSGEEASGGASANIATLPGRTEPAAVIGLSAEEAEAALLEELALTRSYLR